MKEQWRPVVGMEGFYEISNRGRIRTLHKIGRHPKSDMLTPVPNAKGYLRVHLTDGKRRFSRVVHRLVLDAFRGPQPSAIHECNHKDGRKANNVASNLEWVTPVENNAHSVANGFWTPAIGEDHGMAILTEADVRIIRTLRGKVTGAELGRRYHVNPQTIRAIWTGRNWKHVA
jgi:hypothetical protein